MKLKVSRKSYFNAAHRLHNPKWSEKKNKKIFGKCNNPNYHGHNYELIVTLEGEVDPQTGFVMNLKTLNKLIQDLVIEKLDHKNLNKEVEEFKTLNPSAEHIAYVIWNSLRPQIAENINLEIKLYETPRNFVTYNGN